MKTFAEQSNSTAKNQSKIGFNFSGDGAFPININQITIRRSNFSRFYLNYKLIIIVLILTLSGSYETSKLLSFGSLAQAAEVILQSIVRAGVAAERLLCILG